MSGWRLVLLASLVLSPASSRGAVGRAALPILTQPVSARPAGMAEAYSAESAGADSLGYNPAGLALSPGPELLLQYHGGFIGDTLLNAGYAQSAGSFGFGASVISYNSGSVDFLDKYGKAVSAAGQRDIAYSGGVAMRLPVAGLAAGIAVKVVRTQMVEEYSGQALAGDAGLRFDVPGTGLSLAAVAQNMGQEIRIADGSEQLPEVLRAGAAWRFDIEAEGSRVSGLEGIFEPELRAEPAPHRLLFTCDGIFRLGDRISSLALGAEFSYHGFFSLRTGVRAPLYGTGTRNTVASLGIGARIRWISLDYAVEATSTTPLHRVSVLFVF